MEKYDTYKILLALLNAFVLALTPANSLYGQVNDMPPPPADYDKCYDKALTADLYETYERDILVRSQYVKTVNVPAVFEDRNEEVLVKEAYTEYIYNPPVYEMIAEEVLVKEGGNAVSESYETVRNPVMRQERRGEWVRKKNPLCFSKNPEECYVLHWQEIPAQYDTLTEKRLTQISNMADKEVKPEYNTIHKKILKTPASVREVFHPAEYKTIVKKVMISPPKVEHITVPAEYKKVKDKRLLERGGKPVWEEVICPDKVNKNMIKQLQLALSNKGHRIPIDGIWGPLTQNAVDVYQRNNNLPVGNLNIATLRALYLL